MRSVRVFVATLLLLIVATIITIHRFHGIVHMQNVPSVAPLLREARISTTSTTSRGPRTAAPVLVERKTHFPEADFLIEYLRRSASRVHGTAATDTTNALSLSLAAALSTMNERAAPSWDSTHFKLAPDRVVLVVMTYARPGYVERLLRSLAHVEGSSCFLI